MTTIDSSLELHQSSTHENDLHTTLTDFPHHHKCYLVAERDFRSVNERVGGSLLLFIEADAVNAYYQAPEHEDVIVERAREYLKRLDVVKNTIIVWRLRRQLPRRRSAGQSRVEDFAAILVDNLGCFRCVAAPRFFC